MTAIAAALTPASPVAPGTAAPASADPASSGADAPSGPFGALVTDSAATAQPAAPSSSVAVEARPDPTLGGSAIPALLATGAPDAPATSTPDVPPFPAAPAPAPAPAPGGKTVGTQAKVRLSAPQIPPAAAAPVAPPAASDAPIAPLAPTDQGVGKTTASDATAADSPSGDGEQADPTEAPLPGTSPQSVPAAPTLHPVPSPTAARPAPAADAAEPKAKGEKAVGSATGKKPTAPDAAVTHADTGSITPDTATHSPDSLDRASQPGDFATLVSGRDGATAAPDRAAAPTPPAPTISARAGRIGQELGIEIARHVDAGVEQMTVRLNPADHGRIEVTMQFDDSGQLRATLTASQPATLDLLRQDSADLSRAMRDAGISTDAQSFRFDSRADQQPGHNRHGNGDPRAATARAPADTTLPLTAEPARYRTLSGGGRINMVA